MDVPSNLGEQALQTLPLSCLIIGLITGFIGTLLGIGGGSLTTPLLILYGVQPHHAIATSLVAIVGTSLGGIYHLFRHRLVRIELAIFLETASILGATLGAYLAIQLPAKTVTLAVATALLISAILFTTTPVESNRKPSFSTAKSHAIAWSASLVAGFLSATAGIGGGVLKTPMLTLLLGLSLK
ncbi:MAG TPA: sulfite exporter TauE/SafE family protein, partial [Pyrodictium sp.]|nr:sulfite exporter TauE/SafE family protein [Pyrodictium sp.]